MTRRVIALVAASLLVVAVPVGARAEQRMESKPYYVGADALLTECELGTGLESGLFGACFDLVGDETSAAIEINDLTGLPVGGAYAFRTASGGITSLGLFCSTIEDVVVPEGSADLVVYVTGPALGALNCVGGGTFGTGTTGTIDVTFELSDTTTPPGMDGERDCLEPVPAAASIAGVTDGGQEVTLSVKVLLDDVAESVGEAVFATAAESYAPLGVTMEVIAFEAVSFDGDEAQLLINQAKAYEGGQRPAGVDIVYVLTSTDIQALGQYGVAGLADCLGGVRYPERAFAVGEVIGFENLQVGPLTFYRDATARTAAHEIGHLMGAQHHYANCVEDAPGDGMNGEVTPCSLMFNSLDTLGPSFSTLSGAVVRGHAVDYASP